MDKDTLRALFWKKKILELKNEETDDKNRQVLGNSPNTVKTKNGIKKMRENIKQNLILFDNWRRYVSASKNVTKSSVKDLNGHDFRERVVILDESGVFLVGEALTFFFGVWSPLDRLVFETSVLFGVPRF